MKLPRLGAWTLACGAGAVAAGRLAGAERGYPLVPAMAFVPYAVGPSALLTAGLLAAGRHGPAAVAGASTAALAGAVLPRGVPGRRTRFARGDRTGTAAVQTVGPRLTVMAANALVGRADASAIVRFVREHGVDVLSVPELTPHLVARLERGGLQDLLPHQVLDARAGNGQGTGLFSRLLLRRVASGGARIGATTASATVDGVDVELLSAHPWPPRYPWEVRRWTESLRALPSAGDGPIRIIAGDLNATLDHGELRSVLSRGYADAAAMVGRGLVGTWPSHRRWPPRLTLDHVLVDRRASVERVDVVDVPGTDHRAVVARVRLPAA